MQKDSKIFYFEKTILIFQTTLMEQEFDLKSLKLCEDNFDPVHLQCRSTLEFAY